MYTMETPDKRIWKEPALWAGLGIIAAVTLAFSMTDLDIRIQSRLYSDAPNGPWPLGNDRIWQILYRLGTIPGIATAVGAVLALGGSFMAQRLRKYRYPALYLVLVMAMGPGLVVNGIGKGLFGRPRPDDLVMFGGMWEYLSPFIPGIPGRGRSFLCGHCSMGFYFMSFFFLVSGWKKWASLAVGACLGLMTGWARVLQGSHFTSDVLLCGAVLFVIQALLAPVARKTPSDSSQPVRRGRVAVFTGAFAVIAVAIFLLSTPVYKEERFIWRDSGNSAGILRDDHAKEWPVSAKRASRVELIMEKGDGNIRLSPPTEPLTIHSTVRGFGFPGAWRKWETVENAALVRWTLSLKGLYSEFNGRVEASYSPVRIAGLSFRTGAGAVAIRLSGYKGPEIIRTTSGFSGIPPDFTRDAGGAWKRKGKSGLAPVNIEITADSASVIP